MVIVSFLIFSTIFGIRSGGDSELKEMWRNNYELKERWMSGLIYFQNQLHFINILFLFLLFCNCFFYIYNFFKRTVKYKENSPK